VCGQCIKACEPDNMRRCSGAHLPAADRPRRVRILADDAVHDAGIGFVIWELTSEWRCRRAPLSGPVPTW